MSLCHVPSAARRWCLCLLLAAIVLLPGRVASAQTPPSAITPTDGVIRLFNGRDLDGLYTWMQDVKYDDPRQVFTVKDSLLRISGDGLGYICTKNRYRDYHLVIEFRWGAQTWRQRVDRARDSGVLVHCVDPDGSFSNTFMASIEAQIIEGGVGDFIVCGGKTAEGKPIPSTLSALVVKDRDGEAVWSPKGTKQTFTRGRVNWYGRDVDWADKIGFRGKEDVESPGQEWTRMDVVCEGSRITIYVNGVKVNEGFDAWPCEGKILVQTELAELFVRRWELWPLGKAPAMPRRASH